MVEEEREVGDDSVDGFAMEATERVDGWVKKMEDYLGFRKEVLAAEEEVGY